MYEMMIWGLDGSRSHSDSPWPLVAVAVIIIAELALLCWLTTTI